nr:hypothetical protein [Candidatus Sigynarchaeota archaeon]
MNTSFLYASIHAIKIIAPSIPGSCSVPSHCIQASKHDVPKGC